MTGKETLKGEIVRIRLKKRMTGEGDEALKKEKATVIERKGAALTETQSCLIGTEKRLIEIEDIQTKTENLQTKITTPQSKTESLQTKTGNFLKRTKGGADHETNEDLGQDQGGVHPVEVESPQIVELQGKGLAVQAGGVMESQEDRGQRSAPQGQGQKDVRRSRLRGRGLGKVLTGHVLALKSSWMRPVGLTDQKRPKSG